MRRALIFMIFLNSITCVTENLAMNVETEDQATIEMPLVSNETPEQDQTDKKQPAKSPELEAQQSGPTKKAIAAGIALVLLIPGAFTAVIFALTGMRKIAETTSPITYLNSPLYDKNPNCTYESYPGSWWGIRPYGGAARGTCGAKYNNYSCVVEKCEGAEEFERAYNKSFWGTSALWVSTPLIGISAYRCRDKKRAKGRGKKKRSKS